jgi:SWI/SNF-related matrix-associated actin-dependent regulator of chromatin subfamily A member 5
LLKQSSIFAKLSGGGGSLPTQKSDAASPERGGKDKRQRKASATAKEAGGGKSGSVHHIHTEDDDVDNDDDDLGEKDDEETPIFLTQQPSSIKFGNLKPYQLEALNWMIHLAGKGLNGILADEMGLGKTLQSISILAYHHEFLKIQGPHLICVPKSTLSNWMNELKRWCPVLRVIKFHGSREDREYMIDNMFTNAAAAHDGKRPDKPQIMDEKGELVDDNSDNPRTWDVCVTTYEVANNESKTLLKFAWKYLIIDEAHRLKNDASLFSKTVRSFRTANRLLLTGYVYFVCRYAQQDYCWLSILLVVCGD